MLCRYLSAIYPLDRILLILRWAVDGLLTIDKKIMQLPDSFIVYYSCQPIVTCVD